MPIREPILVFDIETVPDLEGFRRIHGFAGLDDEAAAQAMKAQRLAEKGTDFQPQHLHRVVAISCCLRSGEDFRVWSLGEAGAPEAELVKRFFDGVEKYRPTLVSWNGSGFDLPVLHYRSLLHGVTAARYWETGDGDSSFRFSNYLSRFHWRHMDLMDVLSGFQGRGRASLDAVATLLGLPGKVGMQGSQVWDVYLAGGLKRIRDYCETDVLNTYLVYLRFQLLRGHLNLNEHAHEVARVRTLLEDSSSAHLKEFAAAWSAG